MAAPIEHLLRSHPRDIGGFSVRRVLPAVPKQMIGPFIFFDHMGPARLAPGEGLDVRPHPHIGLATVTYLFEGEILHRDSLGSVQPIRPGDVNWMTAGRGIAHSERTPPELRAAGPGVHGIQTWVALPRASEEVEPSFFHHPKASLPVLELQGATLRVIAGRAFGVRSPVAVFSDTLYAAVDLEPGASLALPPEHAERGVYVVEGNVTIGDTAIEPGQLAVLAEGVEAEVRAPFSATLMLLGGAKMDGPRFIWWNFVSSARERIERAKADWRADRFGAVPGDTERIPLPER
jgi:redox-sensitive bicupin YhaK (pirin superfamily)